MIDFPASPVDQQLFSASNGVVYKYSAAYTSWLAQNPAPALGGTGDFCAAFTSSVATGTTRTTLVPPTILSGNSGLWYSTSTGRFTPPAGRYCLYGMMTAAAPSGAVTAQVALLKNGTQVTQVSEITSGANFTSSPTTSMIADANGSDYFELQGGTIGAAGTCTQILFQAFPLTGLQGPTGPAGVTQTVFFETGAVATGTTPLPFDDTIPQITEGNEYMTLAITPQSATSKLVIEVVCFVSSSATSPAGIAAALFQDATANALAAGFATSCAAGSGNNIKLSHVMTSGTTSATTFRVRAGTGSAGTTTFNGLSGARYFGGVMASSIVIREVP